MEKVALRMIKVHDDVHEELLKLTVKDGKKRTLSQVIRDLLKRDK